MQNCTAKQMSCRDKIGNEWTRWPEHLPCKDESDYERGREHERSWHAVCAVSFVLFASEQRHERTKSVKSYSSKDPKMAGIDKLIIAEPE